MTVKRRLLVSSLALLVATSIMLVAVSTPATNVGTAVSSLRMFRSAKWTAHYRVPSDEQVEELLYDKGISLPSSAARTQAVQAFRQEWAKRNPTTPNPKKLEKIEANERKGAPQAP